jgi:hypothetical protein
MEGGSSRTGGLVGGVTFGGGGTVPEMYGELLSSGVGPAKGEFIGGTF